MKVRASTPARKPTTSKRKPTVGKRKRATAARVSGSLNNPAPTDAKPLPMPSSWFNPTIVRRDDGVRAVAFDRVVGVLDRGRRLAAVAEGVVTMMQGPRSKVDLFAADGLREVVSELRRGLDLLAEQINVAEHVTAGGAA